MSLRLSRPYTCRFGAPTIDRVDPRVFDLTYFAKCMDCAFCHDNCCQYGADVEAPRVAAIDRYRAELEQYLGVPRAEWFREDPDDYGYLDDPDYPGGSNTRTAVRPLPDGRSPHNGEACVFLDPAGRGCRLHRFALERGIDVHEIKPLVCLMFPVLFRDGEFVPAYEFDVADLICEGPGPSLYRSARADILYYFGPELVAEMDAMERATRGPAGGAVPLPVCEAPGAVTDAGKPDRRLDTSGFR